MKKTNNELQLDGMVIALTGRLSKPKEAYADLIAANGGTFSNTVTKKVTHVVSNDSDSANSKLDKARKYGAKIVGEELLTDLKILPTTGVKTGDVDAKGDQTKLKAPPKVLLANKFDSAKHTSVVGWWVSEKLDGVRAWWDGEKFWSRLGNMFYAPDWFCDAMPSNEILDGELYLGRGRFQETVSIVRSHPGEGISERWREIRFMVFDIPSQGKKTFEERLKLMEQACNGIPHAHLVEQRLLRENDDLNDMLKAIESAGGEGLMLRAPQSKYVGFRSNSLLKVKSFKDDEAKVIGYAEEGRGRLKGLTGSLLVVNRNGKKFKVGSGLTDEDRKTPPSIGSIITYRYQELTDAGNPRFPTYVGVAIDKDFP